MVAQDTFVNLDGTQLLQCFRILLKGKYAGCRLLFCYRLTFVSGVGVATVKGQGSSPEDRGERSAACTNSSTPVSSKLYASSATWPRGRSKKAYR